MQRIRKPFLILLLFQAVLLAGCAGFQRQESVISLDEIPEFSSDAYVAINGNVPFFEESELTEQSFESYSDLDYLGRCGVAYACVGVDLMPTEERGSIGSVKPSGWQTVRYDDLVDGKYLYNRCHLIGWQLTGENANECNLITGTRYLNTEGMLPFENMVADYVKETENHVMYRVTPIFEGTNLVANGVLMEAYSVEDSGDGICFCVYCYNAQPSIEIDYATGESWVEGSAPEDQAGNSEDAGTSEVTYIGNKNSMKFHTPDCTGASSIKEENKYYFTGTREEIIAEGYSPCGKCNP